MIFSQKISSMTASLQEQRIEFNGFIEIRQSRFQLFEFRLNLPKIVPQLSRFDFRLTQPDGGLKARFGSNQILADGM
jgi:hypothetical protein